MLLVRLTVSSRFLIVTFWGVKVIFCFLTARGIIAPNFCVVQGSIVFYSLYAIINGINTLNSLSDNSLLIYENIVEFCLLICTVFQCLFDFFFFSSTSYLCTGFSIFRIVLFFSSFTSFLIWIH